MSVTRPVEVPSEAEERVNHEQTTLHETIVPGLRAMILEGELPSGSRIPEAALCQRFNISRTPLREALKVLAFEGFVELRPNRGAIVSRVDQTIVASVFEVKGALERLIGLTAATRVTSRDMVELEKIHEKLGASESQSGSASYTRLNYDFHQRLAQATYNPVLIQTYAGLQQQIWRFRFAVNEIPERRDASFAEHEWIMVALRVGARLDLAERLEEHNRRTGDAIAKAFAEMDQDGRTSKLRIDVP